MYMQKNKIFEKYVKIIFMQERREQIKQMINNKVKRIINHF